MDSPSFDEMKKIQEEYSLYISQVNMHKTLITTALNTIEKSKNEMAELALKLTACQTRLLEIMNEGKEKTSE